MTPDEEPLRDAAGIGSILDRLAGEIADSMTSPATLRLVGVRTRGVPLAHRLAERLRASTGAAVPVGAIDITLYRDDLGQGGSWPVLRGTEIDFGVDGAEIILVDDVLYTGRTTRAALNVVCDLGRPARVRLLTLVDRGHRELPIQPDFVGLAVPTARNDRVGVRLAPVDDSDAIVVVRPAGPASGGP